MNQSKKSILNLAIYAGEIMLKNGAETYRVEDTINRICKAYDIPNVESFVTPTGIFVSVNDETMHHEPISFIKRIHGRTIDLSKVSKVNTFSRSIVNQWISIDEGLQVLKEIEQHRSYNQYTRIFCAGITSAFFGVLLGANTKDFFSSFIISMLVLFIILVTERYGGNAFIQNIIGGAATSILAILFVQLNLGSNVDKIIISSIMPLLPGVAITNAVRDSISGDLLSGIARAVEAFIIAISIAAGVGIVFNIWIHTLGGTF